MNTSNTKFNMSLSIEYRSNHIFFYKIKIPTLNLLSIWSNLIPGKRKHYSKLYLNLLKNQKQIKNQKSNWIFKKKKLISSFKNNLYIDKSRQVLEQELKPKLRQFKEMYLKGYTPQEERILIFNTKKQNLLIKPPLLKVDIKNNKAQTYFSKLRKSKLPQYNIVKKSLKTKPLKSSLRAKFVKNLFLKNKIKPSALLLSSIKVKASKVRLYPLPSSKSIKAKAEITKTSIVKTAKTPVVRSTKVAKVKSVKAAKMVKVESIKREKQKPLLLSLIKVKEKIVTPFTLFSGQAKKTKAASSPKTEEKKAGLAPQKTAKYQKKVAKTGKIKTKPLPSPSIKVKETKVKVKPSLIEPVNKK